MSMPATSTRSRPTPLETPASPRLEIRVGLGSCGLANGAHPVFERLRDEVERLGLSGEVFVKSVGCAGFCHREPLVEIVEREGRSISYARVTVEDVEGLLRQHLETRRRRPRPVSSHQPRKSPEQVHEASEGTPHEQVRIVLENCGIVDPDRLDEAVERGAYEALASCRAADRPEDVIDVIERSGLRGRGGAGFPTGRKWRLTRAQAGPRVVICNGDEGDPGAFMDRLVLESDPHRVVEGLAIAAWAVGAERAFFYIRAEYPLAVRRIRQAILQAEGAGFLAPLRMEVREGAGAFVCGEETALIASLEGRRGTPRLRPPYPAVSGWHGRPTSINNVETLATIPWILRHGAEAFAAHGTESSKGTKVFALAGKVRHGGLVEVPMGITLREIVEDLGGGTPSGRPWKAVQLGGPSGGCLPAHLGDTPVDYEALAATGAIMGSGGLVVLDERDCMVDISRFFLHFTREESCGKCTYCRVGTQRLAEILDRLCTGTARPDDLEILETLADRVQRGSLCGLGQTAPNPVLSSLRWFREEFEAHMEGRCPSGRCSALVRYRIEDHCIGCTLCAQACPVDAIPWTPWEVHSIDEARCTRCDLCRQACPEDAVEVVSP